MRKFFTIFTVFLFLTFTLNTIATVAQPKIYSQGFYTLKDLNLSENVIYNVQNVEPYVDGMIFIIDSNERIQQTLLIPASSIKYTLIPLKADYKFIIYGDVRLIFS